MNRDLQLGIEYYKSLVVGGSHAWTKAHLELVWEKL